jgi:hypothetical protein
MKSLGSSFRFLEPIRDLRLRSVELRLKRERGLEAEEEAPRENLFDLEIRCASTDSMPTRLAIKGYGQVTTSLAFPKQTSHAG